MTHGSLQDVALDTLLCLFRLGSIVFLATWSPSARGFSLRIMSVLALRFDGVDVYNNLQFFFHICAAVPVFLQSLLGVIP